MELLTFLRRRRHRLEALLLVPLLAVAATVALTLQAPDRYVSSATLRMPSPDASYRAARVDAATSFVDAADDPEVLGRAAEGAGLPVAEVDDAVTVRREGEVVTVDAATTSPGSTAAVLVTSTLEAGLDEVFAPALAESAAALAVASERATAAEDDLAAYEAEVGQIGVLDQYRAITASLGDLRAQRAAARGDGRTGEAAALTELIDQGDEQRLALEPLIPEYRRRAAALDRAEAQITDAQRQLDDRRAALDGAKAEALRVTSPTAQESVSAQLAERSLAAGAVGLLLAAAALGVLEVVRPVDDPDEVADADDDAHDRAAAPDPGPARSEAGRDDRDPSSAPPGADADPGGTAAGRAGGAADAVTTPVGG